MIHTLNDNKSAWSTRAWVILGALNAIGALASGYYGLAALIDPTARQGIEGPATSDLTVYATLFGIRSVLLTVAVLWLLVIDRRTDGARLLPFLLLAGLVQTADTIALPLITGDVTQAIGPLVGAVTHLVSAGLLYRRPSRLPSGGAV